MGNKRIIVFFLTGILFCLIILVAGRNRRRFLVFPDQQFSFLGKDIFDDVHTVVIERSGRRIEVRRDGSRWRMLAPIDSGVDQAVMARLINGFDGTDIKDRFDIDEIKKRDLSIADYGFYPARARVVFHTDKKKISFLFGSFSTGGKDIYVRKNNGDRLFVVSSDVFNVIPENANMLRSHRLVNCDPALINSVDIRRPEHPFLRLVFEKGVWTIEEPVKSKASFEKVGEFLDSLFDVRISKFVWPTLDNVMDVADYEKALEIRKALYGLEEDVGTSIRVHTIDGSFDSEIVIGHNTEKIGESVYVLMDDGRAIGVVSNNITDVVNVNSDFFRSKKIFYELTDPLNSLQLMIGRDIFVLNRTNDLWRIASPASEPADQQRVQRSVDQLLALKADRIETRVQQDESGAQGVEVNYIEFSSHSAVEMVAVKKTDYEGRMYEFSFADEPEVYYVAGSNMPAVLVDRDALLKLRDRTLLSLSTDSIRSITIRKSGEPALSIDYMEEDQNWHLSAKGVNAGRLNPEVLNDVLDSLQNFRADEVVKIGLSSDDLIYYGFSRPWLEINVDVNMDDAVRKTILVGRSAGGGIRYVMVRGSQTVFAISEKRLVTFADTLTLESIE
ncbi:MAG: DUF4340 domain-containing protein [Kiritimatiellia bacterium]